MFYGIATVLVPAGTGQTITPKEEERRVEKLLE